MRLALPALVLAAIVLAAAPHLLDSLPGCGFRRLTGLQCPGCGSTRAVQHLLRGELGAAVDKNPLLVVGTPLLLAAWAWHARRMVRAGRSAGEIPAWAIYAVLATILAFWLLRNLGRGQVST